MSSRNEIISIVQYEETDPLYQQIRNMFLNKLKDIYDCENFTEIADYVCKIVFKDKKTKADCYSLTKEVFHEKNEEMINFIWTKVKELEGGRQGSDIDYYHKKGGSKYKDGTLKGRGAYDNKYSKISKYSKGKERSRSNSHSSEEDSYKYKKGFYPPKSRGYTQPMMPMPIGPGFGPMQGGYPMRGPVINPYMQRFNQNKFHPKKNKENQPDQQEQNKEGALNENEEQKQEGVVNKGEKEHTEMNIEMTEEQKQKLLESEAFNKLSPEEQKAFLEKRIPTKKVRCKNWPNCKDPNCIYAHPKETCPYFPTCIFGDKCCYIHPSIPCKFGYRCTRMGCAYSHPPGFNQGGMFMYPNMMQPMKKHKKPFNPSNNNKSSEKKEGEGEEQKPIENNNQEETKNISMPLNEVNMSNQEQQNQP